MGKVLRPYEPKESEIEMAVCHYLHSRGFFFWKNPSAGYFDAKLKRFRRHVNPYVKRGVGDIVVIVGGVFWNLEIKTKSGKQSEFQKEFQKGLEKAGGFYHLIRSVEDLKQLFACRKLPNCIGPCVCALTTLKPPNP